MNEIQIQLKLKQMRDKIRISSTSITLLSIKWILLNSTLLYWQDIYVGLLQFLWLCIPQERDGMRAILESYDSELAATEYSPQLSKRLKEAEDVLQRTQSHYVEMEVSCHASANTPHSLCIHTDATLYSGCLLWDGVTVKGAESVFAKAKTILYFILRLLYKTGKIWHKYQDWRKVW